MNNKIEVDRVVNIVNNLLSPQQIDLRLEQLAIEKGVNLNIEEAEAINACFDSNLTTEIILNIEALANLLEHCVRIVGG